MKDELFIDVFDKSVNILGFLIMWLFTFKLLLYILYYKFWECNFIVITEQIVF